MNSERLAIHSTHEAAVKIAGIGAVLDGLIPQKDYKKNFDKTILAGAYSFHKNDKALKNPAVFEVIFDSSKKASSKGNKELNDKLAETAEDFNVRILFGKRIVGADPVTDSVYVLLCSPDGIKTSKLDNFKKIIYQDFNFNMPFFESFPAVRSGIDRTLDRIIEQKNNDIIQNDEYDHALKDAAGRLLNGGADIIDGCLRFPDIKNLDSFMDFKNKNHYLIELQFYLYSAPPLWDALKKIISFWEIQSSNTAFFCHDWIGVPLYWSLILDPNYIKPGKTVYFAHEARLARMLVEGNMTDRYGTLNKYCHPEGHDITFYGLLNNLLVSEHNFIDLKQSFGFNFNEIFYHLLNREAYRFDRIIAVGENVLKETELICRSIRTNISQKMHLCPNGIPDTAKDLTIDGIISSNKDLKDFAKDNYGFYPDYIFTSVSRCELSKAPWRIVNFFSKFAENNPGKKALLIWILRPKPLPTDQQIKQWKNQYGWPNNHLPRSIDGDLSANELKLWESINKFNTSHINNYRILYINQYGWDEIKLGALKLNTAKINFKTLRTAADVELGLSIYEPFGIAPLEPFGSGAVCVLSDSSGCALHMDAMAKKMNLKRSNFVIGGFTSYSGDLKDMNIQKYLNIENEIYGIMSDELSAKLEIPREERFEEAKKYMKKLSWDYVVRNYFLKSI